MWGLSIALGPQPAQELKLLKRKKKRHFVNQYLSLLASPLEGAPAALRGGHTSPLATLHNCS